MVSSNYKVLLKLKVLHSIWYIQSVPKKAFLILAHLLFHEKLISIIKYWWNEKEIKKAPSNPI